MVTVQVKSNQAAFWTSISLSNGASGAVAPYSMVIVTKGTVQWQASLGSLSSVNSFWSFKGQGPLILQSNMSSVPDQCSLFLELQERG